MREPVDALRSLAKHTWRILDENQPEVDWAVTINASDSEWEPPIARVSLREGNVAGPANRAEYSRAFTIQVYPTRPDATDADASAELAMLNAMQLESAFLAGFAGTGSGARTRRVPLYDFDGITLDETSDDRFDGDYLRVVSPTVITDVDPDDPRLITVTVQGSITWAKATGPDPTDPILNGFTISP